ncbi:MAG TPA: glutamine amidotransferase [Verrucomicrobiae bacterium]
MVEFSYTPKLEWIIGAAGAALLFLWLSYYKAKGKPTGLLKAILVSLRLFAIAAIVICLLDPQWVETVKHEQRSRLAVLLDKSKSMSIEDLQGTRLASGQKWLSDQLKPLAPAGVQISTFAFDQQLTALPSANSANPTGAVTALAESMEALLAIPSPDPLIGVVLVSDGIDNTTRLPEKVARTYRRKGIPIHTVTVGTTNDMEDVILENVQVKRAVPNEAPTRLSLHLRSPGFTGKKAAIQVRGQKGIVAAQEVTLNGAEQRVEIAFTPRDKGFQIYETTVLAQKGEWLATNNRRLFGLEVVDPTIRVIYMEGTPQTKTSPKPEWKYLKDALLSDPNISVKVLYRKLGTDGKYLNTIDVDPETGEKIYPVEHPREGFPRSMSALLEYDVVIHSDIKKESFTPQQLQNIATLVEQHGGGFVMIGGNSAFGKGGYHLTVLDRIIPVAMEQENDSASTPFHMQLARNSPSHPIMSIGTTPEETVKIWTSKFPMLYGFNRVDRAKPGATVLALNPTYDTQFGPGILMAVQEIGKGRSMAFTSDTTRTWGRDFETLWGEPRRVGTALTERNSDARYYRQFWVNAIRWLASGKMGRTNNPVTLELAQSYCVPNEAVTARVKVRDTEMKELSNAEVHLTLPKTSGTNSTIRARYDAAAKAYVADVRPATTGNFVISAIARQGTAELGGDRQLLVAEGTDIEMADLRARPDFMANLARDTKGESFSLATAPAGSPGYVFAKAPEPKVEFRREPLWDKAVWLSLILGCVALEWTIRRMRGLA